MNDATASDNCGEVTIEVMAKRPRAMPRAITPSFARHGNRRCGNRARPPDHHGSGHHSSWFTFVPADYTVECSDEMPMEDATASDNCGEVTIEVIARRRPAMLQATTRSFARSRRPTMRATALATQTVTVQDTTAPEFTFVPATTP